MPFYLEQSAAQLVIKDPMRRYDQSVLSSVYARSWRSSPTFAQYSLLALCLTPLPSNLRFCRGRICSSCAN